MSSFAPCKETRDAGKFHCKNISAQRRPRHLLVPFKFDLAEQKLLTVACLLLPARMGL